MAPVRSPVRQAGSMVSSADRRLIACCTSLDDGRVLIAGGRNAATNQFPAAAEALGEGRDVLADAGHPHRRPRRQHRQDAGQGLKFVFGTNVTPAQGGSR